MSNTWAYSYANITANYFIGTANSTITFNLNTTNPIPEGGYLTIGIASTLTLTVSPPLLICLVGCNSTTATVTFGSSTITITGLFPTGSYAASGSNI